MHRLHPRVWFHRLTARRVTVEGPSMEPTFPSGCRLSANAWAYLVEAPARGDVVIVVSPEQSSRIEVKRIMGLPNEEVEWNGGRIRVEGVPLEEPYAWIREPPPGDEPRSKTRLGANEYFVAGDNRLYSRDSRHFGPVPRSAVLARVEARVPTFPRALSKQS